MTYEVTIPEIGESVTEALILRWIKQPGEAIGKGRSARGARNGQGDRRDAVSGSGASLSEIVCAEGETVPIGAVIARIEEGAVAASPGAAAAEEAQGDLLAGARPAAPSAPPAPAPAAEPTPPAPVPAAEAKPVAAPAAPGERRILPAARRLIAEHGLDASLIPSTGKGGRLLKSDVAAWLAAREEEPEPSAEAVPETAAAAPAPTMPSPPAQPAPPAAAPPAAAAAGERAEERVPMTPIRRRIAERLVEAQQQAALLTTFNEIDMSAVMDFRRRYRDAFSERHDVRLGFLSFFVKAAVDALRRFPRLNAEITGTDIIYRNYYDIGIAVSTDRGLMVPVLRSAERMSFAEIESSIGDFAGTGPDRQDPPRRTPGRHLHDHQRRHLRLAAVDADHQPAAERRARPARHPAAARRRRRRSRRPADDVRRPELRPPHRRRPRGGHLPGPDQGGDRGSGQDADRGLT